MSNTRRTRQPGGDRERERRHMAWLNHGDNSSRIAGGAQAAYEAEGRGFWFVSDSLDGPDCFTRLQYVPAADIGLIPAGSTRDMIARMVATYDPAIQFVVVILDGGCAGAYKVRHVHAALS